jgi:hypothetical protein
LVLFFQVVSTEEGEELAGDFGVPFFETSAKKVIACLLPFFVFLLSLKTLFSILLFRTRISKKPS